VKQEVKYVWLLCPSPTPASHAFTVGLGGIFLTANGFAGRVLVGYVVHLLMVAVVPSGV
jgi:hypothetical protein